MINFYQKTNERIGYRPKKKPIKYLLNLFKRKQAIEDSGSINIESPIFSTMDVKGQQGGGGITRTSSLLSVGDIMVVPCPPSPAKGRDIDMDMEALRISRQDNPFIKQVLASRESLADSLEESESDDINLMSQEFSTDFGTDPFSLPEVHQHMIRSPPPASWPKSPNFKMFRFPADDDEDSSEENLSKKSPSRMSASPRLDLYQEDLANRARSCAVSPRLNLPLRPHQRSNSDFKGNI
uniref:Uncharacterized protein n=1 Tax=Clastoptera arizonana TaxID=38151 RepID=A0A1B6DLY6_9HEMI